MGALRGKAGSSGLAAALALTFLVGCGGGSATETDGAAGAGNGAGGSSGSTGQSDSAGRGGAGGQSATGGQAGAGGQSATGGQAGAGGQSATGGQAGAGGQPGSAGSGGQSGGAQAGAGGSGGSAGRGGVGGQSGTGGRGGSGGSAGQGGGSGHGGTGGQSGAGGHAGSGGQPGSGGSGGQGGAGDRDAGVDRHADAACVPACANKACGGDGCGGICASCPGGQHCTAAFQCVANPTNGCAPGSGLDPQAPWPTTGRCYARQSSTSVVSVQKPAVMWGYPVGEVTGSVIGRDGKIYYGGESSGGVYSMQAVNPNGTMAWTIQNVVPSQTPTIGADGTIYFVFTNSLSSTLWAVNPDGSVRWKATLANSSQSGIVVGADGTIYLGDAAGTLNAFNADGSVRFTRASVAGENIPAVGSDGTLYLAYGGITAMSADGTQLWQKTLPTSEQIFAGISIGPDGTLYVPYADTVDATGGGGVVALDPATGAIRWTTTLPDFAITMLAVGGDGTIYVPAEFALTALTPAGSVRWTFSVADFIGGIALGGDGTVYLTSEDENFYALNPDGSLKWNLPMANGGAPSIGADGTLYVGGGVGLSALGCGGGACGACVPICTGKRCGPDGCGGLCGACASGTRCELLSRTCQPVAPPAPVGACGDTRGLQPGAPWPALAACPTRVAEGAVDGPHATPTVHWTFAPGVNLYIPPTVAADGTVYLPASNGKLYAVTPQGTARWTFSVLTSGAGFASTPALGADGTIYTSAGGPDNRIYAIHPNGTKRWSLHFDAATAFAPMVGPDGTVYAETETQLFRTRVVTIDPLSGTLQWATYAGEYLQGGPTLAPDGTIYDHGNDVVSFDTGGGLRWEVATSGDLPSTVALLDKAGNVYAGWETLLYSFAPDGLPRWTYNPYATGSSKIEASLALGGDGSILVPLQNDVLYALVALDPATGDVRWGSSSGGSPSTGPLVDASGWIYYVGDDDQKLYALDGAGNLQWSLPLSTGIVGAPVLGGSSLIYLTGTNGTLYAVGP